VDFLLIAISWQSPWRYHDIVTIAITADDQHQALEARHATYVRALTHPSPYKYRDNGVRVLTTWRELNDDASRAVTAVLNSRSHGTLVTRIEVMWWPASNSTGYIAEDTPPTPLQQVNYTCSRACTSLQSSAAAAAESLSAASSPALPPPCVSASWPQ